MTAFVPARPLHEQLDAAPGQEAESQPNATTLIRPYQILASYSDRECASRPACPTFSPEGARARIAEMDFAALMSKEFSKSTKKPIPSETGSPQGEGPKFLRRSEVEAQRAAAYAAEQKALEAAREAKAAAKRKREDEVAAENAAREEKRRRLAEEARQRREAQEREEERARRQRLGLPELRDESAARSNDDDDDDDGDDDFDDENENKDGNGDSAKRNQRRKKRLSEAETVEQLRALGQPARLFGESHAGRLRRLRKLGAVVTSGPIPTTLALVEGKEMRVDGTMPRDEAGRRWLFRQLASYFTMVLTEYERAMEGERRDTTAGKTAYNAMVQTRENMKPLFRKFEAGDLDDSLIEPIMEIVKALQERRYVDANDGYLRLSIGKAAWPIGVTMVGIHERSAREKLHGGEKGHVMGDEVTRKFLQSIKRCLTFAQVRWPPENLRQLMG